MSVPTTLEAGPLDPALAGFLEAGRDNPPIESLPLPVARQLYRDMAAALSAPPPAIASVEDRAIAGPGGPIVLRIYAPAEALAAPLPLLLYVHGGGFVIGDLETHDAVCRTLCAHTGMKVVAVDYRLAPEHPFPAAPDDVEAALRWLHANAAELGGDARRIAVAGDSAGAQLALVAARRTQASVAVRALGLVYPLAQDYRDGGASYVENEGKFLTRSVMRWFQESYLGGRPGAEEHPEFALLRSGSLAGLPATWVATMGHDPLRDEGHALARRLDAAGVAVTHSHHPAAIHACIHFTALSAAGSRVLAGLAEWLRGAV